MKRIISSVAAALLLFSTNLSAQAPIIGISSYNSDDSNMADLTYINAVRLAGGIPIVIPMTSDESQIQRMLSMVDGLVMTGGADFDPFMWYGEEPRREMRIVQPERDDYDVKMARNAVRMGIPLLGVCRGEQLLAVAFGGSLWQDVPTMLKGNVKHNQMPTDSKYPSHSIILERDSWMYGTFGKDTMRVNSLHHQGIKKMPIGLKAVAHSADGLPEAVERTGRINGFEDAGGWIFGVQFHPEIMIANGGDMTFLPIFQELVHQAQKFARKK